MIELTTNAPDAWRFALDFQDVLASPEATQYLLSHDVVLTSLRVRLSYRSA